MLGSQGQPPKQKQRPWDESILVPFLLRYPEACGNQGRKVTTPINTPDILPTLLSLAGIAIPDTIEGEDISRLVRDNKSEDRTVLFMNVSPFGAGDRKGFRGIRTSRYTYVRDSDGPWLMYDNKVDPYQMKNLIGDSEYSGLQKKLEAKLQFKLKQKGDKLHPKQHYLEEWGYTVDKRGNIPYWGNFKVQSPANKLK